MKRYSSLEYALFLIKNRAQTRKQIEEKLTRKKYEPDDIAKTILQLEKANLINDETFAQNYVRDKISIYRRGRWRIVQELRQKGVVKELIDKAIEDISEDDELEAARSLIKGRERQWADLEPQKKYLRSVGLLSRRGFSGKIIKQILSEKD